MALNYLDLYVKTAEKVDADFFNRRYQLIVAEIASAEENVAAAQALAQNAVVSATTIAQEVSGILASGTVFSVAGLTGAIGAGALKTALSYSYGDVTGAAPLASPGFTGTPTAPTPTGGDSSTKLATTAFCANATAAATAGFLTTIGAAATYAPLSSPSLTGAPTAPTAARNTSTTQIATTAFVMGQSPPPLFGDGSDGSATILSGTTTLTRDMYYANLTITGTGALATNGCRVFVAGTLDLSSAPAGAIVCNGLNGNPGISAAGIGTSNAFGTDWFLGQASGGGGGGGNGGSTISNFFLGGSGGTGGAPAGGAANGSAATVRHLAPSPYPYAATPPYCAGNAGGGGGGQDSTHGGSGGGTGGGGILIFAGMLIRGASTAAGAIAANGGNGGNPYTLGNNGGGGGGGGGFISIVVNSLSGVSVAGAITANGGTGGGGYGTGKGGQGGAGGAIQIVNLGAGTASTTTGTAGSTSLTTIGGVAGTCNASL